MDSEHDLYKSFADNIADSSDELVEEPPVWPVILWVAFQVQSQIRCNSSSVDVDALITIIESRAQEHSGLWSWDHTDDQMLRAGLLSRNGASAWIDRYPPSWREYILSLGSHDWVRLGDLTRRSARERLAPPEDDAAIRAGAIAVWTSVRSVSPLAPELSTILALDYFVPQDTNHRQFLSCLLEHLENHHDRDLSLELDHWDDPRAWPEYNRRMLQSSVVDKYRNVPLVHVVGNAYMLHQMPHALPQCLISFVFAHLLKKFGDDQGWDVTTCLANFHQVLSSVLEFSNLIKDEDIQNATSALMRTDILCVCAQFASIFFDLKASQNICKAPNDHIQQLLDLLQDLLDYRLLNPLIHSVLLKGLLKFSKKLKRYPRCFALRDLRLAGDPVAAGSFGDIWKTQFHRETVCVKVMRVYEEGDIEALLKGFHHEALIWRQLAHPNVLPFLARPRLCLVSPWMENGNVSSYLKRDPAGCNRLTLVLDVALGLEYLHGLNLVHGDLKGLNVLVTHSGRAVLADFGLSSVVTDSKIAIFSASTVKTGGTTRWQAPELLYGGRTNLASDVYALACVFYEIFTGTIPFSELLEVAVILRVIQGDRPKQHPGISASIWNLMMECWETKPSDRPSAVHIVSRLRDCSIGAVQNDAALDWDRWYTAEFRSSLQEHTLFKIDYSPQVSKDRGRTDGYSF
ncbi:kinase-like domain-containing protein [Mycena olivaceomarginata]|nr:kinase-like domain-containing protein [Mycena olivaceomarginata]